MRLAPRYILLLSILALLVPGGVLALSPDRLPSQYLYDRYGREHGLPSDTVWVARQDHEGYLWLGTKNGLARFDGVRFTLYNKQAYPEFLSNDVRDIEITADGSLWLATYGGGALRLIDGEFEPLTKADGLADNVVHDIHIGSDGAVWFATALGISRLRDDTITNWTSEDGLADNSTFRVGEDSNGDIWVGTLTNGLSHFDGETFRNYSDGSGLDSTQVHLLFDDPELGLIATTITGSSYRLEAGGPACWRGRCRHNCPGIRRSATGTATCGWAPMARACGACRRTSSWRRSR
ncbi:ligand-binding sensor domain-containing protein [Kineobactrum salinum]|uniref:Histidine kinase n=1 Tax=Kineobactrum salinum TaxID=2708301 RepID=A0A6C0U776_9GAMM|nr:two-component regulator propeller domain-containing protein [Kineobactrum salinum]QIB65334.1 hypothetical protein G3T16_07915 [Kineobactrum salinum]